MTISSDVLVRAIALCGIVAGLASPASADESPCPAQLDYFLLLYIEYGLGNWPYMKWVEKSSLYVTEGSGADAECYYIGKLYDSHPYKELRDPNYHWHIPVAVLLGL